MLPTRIDVAYTTEELASFDTTLATIETYSSSPTSPRARTGVLITRPKPGNLLP